MVSPSGKISILLNNVSPDAFHISKLVLFSPVSHEGKRLDVIKPPGSSPVPWSNLNAALLGLVSPLYPLLVLFITILVSSGYLLWFAINPDFATCKVPSGIVVPKPTLAFEPEV